ncbi:MAG: NAD+ synthase [Chloroflexota bacterium]|nr:NAD+ synthase [Chloroflexota bacterium]
MASTTETSLQSRASHGLRLDTALAEQVLVRFIADAISKFGFTRAVVATSGGIDSALTCALAARALGPKNVLALMLPYRTSNPASRGDAETLVEALGVESHVIDVSQAVDGYLDELDDLTTPVRRGNVMSRTRMIATYDQSEAFDALVVGTSNKTELLLGYGTLHGDMASAVNPIGDLYKTQVRQLASALDVPAAILDKPPSADLWHGQSDEDELGFTYESADEVLHLLVDEWHTPDEIVAGGYDADLVTEIRRRVQQTQFKRRPPVIAKLSDRTIDRDFRYPRDWGR